MGVGSPQTSQSARPRPRGAVNAGTEAEVRQRAVRHAEIARREEVESVVSRVGSRHASSGGRFTHETREGREIEPDVSLKEERLAARRTEDGQALEAPVLKRGIACLDGIAGAMIEVLPGGRADREIAHQAEGTIRKAFGDVALLQRRISPRGWSGFCQAHSGGGYITPAWRTRGSAPCKQA